MKGEKLWSFRKQRPVVVDEATLAKKTWDLTGRVFLGVLVQTKTALKFHFLVYTPLLIAKKKVKDNRFTISGAAPDFSERVRINVRQRQKFEIKVVGKINSSIFKNKCKLFTAFKQSHG